MMLGGCSLPPHTVAMNSQWMRTVFTLGMAIALRAQNSLHDPGWPRSFSDGSASLVVYQPQIDGWSDFKTLTGRCAFALRTQSQAEPVYGTLRFRADSLVDADSRIVLLRAIQAFDMRFPSSPGGTSPERSQLVRRLLPAEAMVISLGRILAFIKAADVPKREAHVLTEPPPIFVSNRPAVLVIVDGEPVEIEGPNSDVRRVVNTNWDLYVERASRRCYLRWEKTWLTAPDLSSTWERASTIPPGLQAEGAVASVEAPRVIVSQRPAELIVIQGTPALSPIAGTRLATVSNTESDLFYDASGQSYYLLTAGRWFRASSLNGPWHYASKSLPADFLRIPADHPRAHVLAAIPGTREADDAVLLASIPRTASVDRAAAKAEVQYVGSPDFREIPGSSVAYAANTPSDVLRVGGRYYLCLQGVWFVASAATGPWQVADRVPDAIYTIPESSPKYHVTYVRVYEATPTTVVVGYTPGYHGAYVAGGVVVWGTGYYYPPYVAAGVAGVPVYWGSAYYTYGASAWYNPATGVYARGGAVYGPYGEYGAAAAYNPRTGTYAQGAGIWGPNGGAAAGRTYNPSTGTYSAGYRAANPYGSWGQGVVGNGNDWARGGYQSTSRGAIAAGETSAGGKGVAFEAANGKNGYLARSGSGDVYAGANGSVYKRDNGQWYQNQNGSWNAMSRDELSAQRQQAQARDLGNRNSTAAQSWSANGGAARRQGVEQRPRFQGRRR
jgi:hypothetical protein